jgi:hypothetical protein
MRHLHVSQTPVFASFSSIVETIQALPIAGMMEGMYLALPLPIVSYQQPFSDAQDAIPTTACHQALETAELLELVLVHVPCRHILPLKRVCKNWKATVERSIPIQESLCLRSVIPVPPSATPRPPIEILKTKDLRVPLKGSSYARDVTVSPAILQAIMRERTDAGSVTLNPMLRAIFPGNCPNYKSDYSSIETHIQSRQRKWEQMYISQPPISSLEALIVVVGGILDEGSAYTPEYEAHGWRMLSSETFVAAKISKLTRASGITIADILQYAAATTQLRAAGEEFTKVLLQFGSEVEHIDGLAGLLDESYRLSRSSGEDGESGARTRSKRGSDSDSDSDAAENDEEDD